MDVDFEGQTPGGEESLASNNEPLQPVVVSRPKLVLRLVDIVAQSYSPDTHLTKRLHD